VTGERRLAASASASTAAAAAVPVLAESIARTRRARKTVRLQLFLGGDRPRLFHRRGAFATALFEDADGACTEKENHFGVRNAYGWKTDVTTIG
jgi:hypothetical protein